MATLCTAICTSHSPYIFATPEEWEEARRARLSKGGIDSSVPVDSPAENRSKHARCIHALGVLREQLLAARPDVIILFGDDQSEQFDFRNYPAFAVFAGETFAGFKISGKFGLPVPGMTRASRPKTAEHWVTTTAHPSVARALLTHLVKDGFDVSFSLELPRPDEGIGHAFMRPALHLAPDYDIPTIPFFVNCYFGPQPTAHRCVQLGKAVRRFIDTLARDLRVAVIGSGGLWHTPMLPNSILDSDFDSTILASLKQGDPQAMADYFDSRQPSVEPGNAGSMERASGGSGMVLGLGGGTGETRNWIVTAAVVDGLAATVVDYVPVYASPVGLAFAYWTL